MSSAANRRDAVSSPILSVVLYSFNDGKLSVNVLP